MLLTLATGIIMSCEENPDFFDVEKAPSIITFEGYPAFSGTFATTDDITIPVTATNAGEIVVERVVTYTVGGDSKTIEETLTTLTGPAATLNTTWDAILATPEGVGLGAIDNVQLDFNVTVDGQPTYKTFDLNFTNPITLGFTQEVDGEDVDFAAPATSFRDSTFSVYFNVNTEQTSIEKVDIFTKINESASFGTTPVQTITGGSTDLDKQIVNFTFPGEADIAPDSSFFVQIVATTTNGKTATRVVEVEASEIPFTEADFLTLRPAAYELAAGVTDTLNQAVDFSELEVISTATINRNPALADMVLVADTTAQELSLEARGATDFVVASSTFSFADATYEATRDAFAAGTPVTGLSDITSLPDEQVVIVRIGDVADTSSERYAIMRIIEVARGFSISQSEVTILYRAR